MAKQAKTMTKAEAVRQTIAAGIVKPIAGADHVKKTFGLDITPTMFSAYKSIAAKKAGPKPTRSNGSVSLDAVADVKKVVDRYGAATVKELMAVLT